jgi:hypothetical protein
MSAGPTPRASSWSMNSRNRPDLIAFESDSISFIPQFQGPTNNDISLGRWNVKSLGKLGRELFTPMPPAVMEINNGRADEFASAVVAPNDTEFVLGPTRGYVAPAADVKNIRPSVIRDVERANRAHRLGAKLSQGHLRLMRSKRS